VAWEPRPTVDVDNLHRLQKLCKPTDKETVRQLREGVLNNVAPQKAMMITLGHSGQSPPSAIGIAPERLHGRPAPLRVNICPTQRFGVAHL
jgi:hypothetical protein